MTADLGGEAPCLLGVVDDHRDLPTTVGARPDLSTAAAIHDLVTRFYRKIVFDDLLAPVFDDLLEALGSRRLRDALPTLRAIRAVLGADEP